jgi:hypothetical protein
MEMEGFLCRRGLNTSMWGPLFYLLVCVSWLPGPETLPILLFLSQSLLHIRAEGVFLRSLNSIIGPERESRLYALLAPFFQLLFVVVFPPAVCPKSERTRQTPAQSLDI